MEEILRGKRLLIGFCVFFMMGTIYLIKTEVSRIRIRQTESVKFVKKKESIRKAEELAEYLQKGKYDYYIIAFFNSICTTCPSGNMIARLINLDKSFGQFYILALLSGDFSERDVENLKVNLGIEFQLKPESCVRKLLF